MQYALPEKVKNTLSQITLSVNIRKLQVSSGTVSYTHLTLPTTSNV